MSLLNRREEPVKVRAYSVPATDQGADGISVFSKNGQPANWVNVGTKEGAQAVLGLTKEQLAALGEYGYIDVDRPEFGAVVTVETNYIW